MMQQSLVPGMRLFATALVVAAALGGQAQARTPTRAPARPAATVADRHHRLGDSLVHCTLLRQPGHAGGHAASRRAARFFAPTSQAVFFAHAGDRCVWRAGAAVRG